MHHIQTDISVVNVMRHNCSERSCIHLLSSGSIPGQGKYSTDLLLVTFFRS